MVDLADILGGLKDAAGGSGWGGATVALLAGDPAPAIAMAASEILGRLFAERPAQFACTHDKNPLRLTREALPQFADVAKYRNPPIVANSWWRLNGDNVQADTIAIEASYFPESGLFDCREDSNPPPSVRYPWPRWRQLVGAYQLDTLKTTPYRSLFAEGCYMLGWAMLTEAEALQRYRLEVGPALDLALAKGLSPDEVAALEQGYQGRVIDGAWHWPDEQVAGRTIGELPLWLPLDSDVRDLSAVLLYLADCGLSSADLELMREVDPTGGRGDLVDVPAAERGDVLASAIVYAAIRSRGNAEAWKTAKAGLSSIARAANVNPTAAQLKGAAGRVCALWRKIAPRHPTTAAQVAQLAAAYSSPTAIIPWLLGAGLVALAAGWAYSNRAKLARKLRGRKWTRPHRLSGRRRR